MTHEPCHLPVLSISLFFLFSFLKSCIFHSAFPFCLLVFYGLLKSQCGSALFSFRVLIANPIWLFGFTGLLLCRCSHSRSPPLPPFFFLKLGKLLLHFCSTPTKGKKFGRNKLCSFFLATSYVMRNIQVIIIWFVKRQTSAALTQGSCMFNAQQGGFYNGSCITGGLCLMFVLKLTGRVQHQVHSLVSADLAFQNCRSYPGVLGYTHTLTHSRAI